MSISIFLHYSPHYCLITDPASPYHYHRSQLSQSLRLAQLTDASIRPFVMIRTGKANVLYTTCSRCIIALSASCGPRTGQTRRFERNWRLSVSASAVDFVLLIQVLKISEHCSRMSSSCEPRLERD